MAGFVRVFTGVVLRYQFQNSQRPGLQLIPGMLQLIHSIQRQLPGGVAAGEVVQPVLLCRGHGHQGRKQGAQGFTQAGGRLQQQGAGFDRVLVHGFRQLPLPGPEVRERKAQFGQQRITQLPVVFFLLGPGLVKATQGFQFLPQFARGGGFGEHGFLVAAGVVIHQRQFHVFAVFLSAQQGAVSP